MRRFLTVFVLLLLGLLVGGPANLVAQSQKGRLQILSSGQLIGTEQFEINATSTEIQARGEVALQIGDQHVAQSVSLLLNSDLSPRRYEWKLEEPRKSWLQIEFEGSTATVAFPRADGQREEQVYDFGGDRVAVLDVNVFHHFLLLARLYDFSRGGVQAIPVFIPQAVQPGEVTVELEEVERQTVDGKEIPVRCLSITSEDNRLLLWLTESGRFVRLSVPGANVEVVPEGTSP